MRKPRNAYKGCVYHAMNRGHNGADIFCSDNLKDLFRKLLYEYVDRYRLNVYSYCIMDNHYHIIIENSSDKMIDMFRVLNGRYGNLYRRIKGGCGAVFQDRYKSIPVDSDGYLLVVNAYTLNNPVRKGLCSGFDQYRWSSAAEYFKAGKSRVTAEGYIEELFSGREQFIQFVRSMSGLSRKGITEISEDNRCNALENYAKSVFKEQDSRKFIETEEAIDNFELRNGILINKIDTSTHDGKKMRGELLVELRDNAGLSYSQISNIPLFTNLKFSSLAQICSNTRKRLAE